MKTIIKDTDLNTYADIMARLAVIRRNRDIENARETKSNHITAWENKCARIRKLTEREGKLLQRLKQVKESEQ